ncbi:MAG: hypothetical protein HOG41_15495, partial [Gammaproteobacteria bacterium]|nr:hypothetical protein [Gammaproteobacteria bacterium]
MAELDDLVSAGDIEAVKAILNLPEDDEDAVDEIDAEVFTLAVDSGFKEVATLLAKDNRFDLNGDEGEPLRRSIRLGF